MGRERRLKGGSFKFVMPAPKHEQKMTLLTKVKQNIHQHKDKSCNLKNTGRQTQGPTGLYELFLLTVPIEEVARWQYIKQLIIFPLNLQTITIT